MKKSGQNTVLIVLIFLVIFGILYVSAMLALKLGWTNVKGDVDANSSAYNTNQSIDLTKAYSQKETAFAKTNNAQLEDLCKLKIIISQYPENGAKIKAAYDQTKSSSLLDRMIFVFNLKNNNENLKADLNNCHSALGQIGQIISSNNKDSTDQNVYTWAKTEEWSIITQALMKDKDKITKAAETAGIEPRLLVAPTMVEQMRLYFTEREYFERIFKPLKILGVTNQMAMGVMSIKEKTAIQVENNLKDDASPYWPGKEYENLLDFKTSNIASERNTRLTDQHDQYFAYLYGALYIKELETQWQKAGFPIDARPEIISTLYNLGFEHSKPNADPKVGGSTLNIDGANYTFGGLGSEFYYSGEMQDIFPYQINKTDI